MGASGRPAAHPGPPAAWFDGTRRASPASSAPSGPHRPLCAPAGCGGRGGGGTKPGAPAGRPAPPPCSPASSQQPLPLPHSFVPMKEFGEPETIWLIFSKLEPITAAVGQMFPRCWSSGRRVRASSEGAPGGAAGCGPEPSRGLPHCGDRTLAPPCTPSPAHSALHTQPHTPSPAHPALHAQPAPLASLPRTQRPGGGPAPPAPLHCALTAASAASAPQLVTLPGSPPMEGQGLLTGLAPGRCFCPPCPGSRTGQGPRVCPLLLQSRSHRGPTALAPSQRHQEVPHPHQEDGDPSPSSLSSGSGSGPAPQALAPLLQAQEVRFDAVSQAERGTGTGRCSGLPGPLPTPKGCPPGGCSGGKARPGARTPRSWGHDAAPAQHPQSESLSLGPQNQVRQAPSQGPQSPHCVSEPPREAWLPPMPPCQPSPPLVPRRPSAGVSGWTGHSGP